MRRNVGVVSVLVLIGATLLFAACATFGGKPWSERTPKEKSSYFMSIYNRQYDDTMTMATNPTLTESQRKIVRTKKDVLLKLWPTIQAYDTIVVHGGIPSVADEQAILDLINRLVAAGG